MLKNFLAGLEVLSRLPSGALLSAALPQQFGYELDLEREEKVGCLMWIGELGHRKKPNSHLGRNPTTEGGDQDTG